MGYTHYWDAPKSIPASLQNATRTIISLAAAEGVAVQYEYDDNAAPTISNDLIRLNGVNDDGHETFCFAPDDEWTFCKTACKDYDLVVVAILTAAKQLVDGFTWFSDGGSDDHADGIALANKALTDL